jgi:hypothetical protein
MPRISPEDEARIFAPIWPGVDRGAFVERTELCVEYLPRIGVSDQQARKARICELAGKLFDSWAKRRIELVKTATDLRTFGSELGTYLSQIVMPHLWGIRGKVNAIPG